MEPAHAMEPELVADTHCTTGEGPLWHPEEQVVYWVDIPPGHLFRHDPNAGGYDRVFDAGEAIGGYTIQADGALLLFMARGAVKTWRDGHLTTVIDEIPDVRDSRFNDVIADPAGRVFCGIMPTDQRPGRLYRLDPDGTLTLLLADLGIPNGMGFTADLTTMYFTDSTNRVIDRFTYDRATGALTNRRAFVRTPSNGGLPDGMSMDTADHVWSARWDGSALHRYAPTGEEVARVPFPAQKVSSISFGGPDYADAYVTTAGGDHRAEEGPGAGALFRVRLGVRGKPAFRSRIGL